METIKLTADDMQEAEAAFARGGIPVILSLSAFDVPTSFTFDLTPNAVRITFNYIDQEEGEPRVLDESLTVFLGKNSGKVLGFVVKPDAQQAREITVRIVQGVDEQLRRATRPNQRMNYELIKRLVRRRVEPLLTER